MTVLIYCCQTTHNSVTYAAANALKQAVESVLIQQRTKPVKENGSSVSSENSEFKYPENKGRPINQRIH